MTSTVLANPRRTTLAALRPGTQCELHGPECQGRATRVVRAEQGYVPACPACSAR